jgi:hypothetical protein
LIEQEERSMRVKGRVVAAAFAVASVLSLAGAIPASAGSNGQLLSMFDHNTNVYSATVHGYNNYCVLLTDTIDNWPNQWFNTAPPDQNNDWWWQDWSGCGSQDVSVTGYPQSFLGGNPIGTWTLSPIPHSQSSSNWTSCVVDPYGGCKAGYEN